MSDRLQADPDFRIVRAILPVDLIGDMDLAISRRAGGFRNRQELIHEAVQALLLELSYPEAPPEPEPQQSPASSDPGLDATASLGQWAPTAEPTATAASRLADLTRINSPETPWALEPEQGVVRLRPGVLFGMHNRDYPSIWSLRLLIDAARNGPVPVERFMGNALDRAWELGDHLLELQGVLGGRLTALFPTNSEKRQAASEAFRWFAMLSYVDNGAEVTGDGPLFKWGVADLIRDDDGELLVAPTQLGVALVAALEGLTLASPHAPDHARAFLEHIDNHSPEDARMLRTVLGLIADEPTREELVAGVHAANDDRPLSVAATNTSGYLARCREWGLVMPAQYNRRYVISELGQETLGEEISA